MGVKLFVQQTATLTAVGWGGGGRREVKRTSCLDTKTSAVLYTSFNGEQMREYVVISSNAALLPPASLTSPTF